MQAIRTMTLIRSGRKRRSDKLQIPLQQEGREAGQMMRKEMRHGETDLGIRFQVGPTSSMQLILLLMWFNESETCFDDTFPELE
jgi:hypothetical protein